MEKDAALKGIGAIFLKRWRNGFFALPLGVGEGASRGEISLGGNLPAILTCIIHFEL